MTENKFPADGYKELADILREAHDQSAYGKGRERHADDRPWVLQPIFEISNQVGIGFPHGQALKKSGEAAGMIKRGQYLSARAELLGSIVYTAAVIHMIDNLLENAQEDDPDFAEVESPSSEDSGQAEYGEPFSLVVPRGSPFEITAKTLSVGDKVKANPNFAASSGVGSIGIVREITSEGVVSAKFPEGLAVGSLGAFERVTDKGDSAESPKPSCGLKVGDKVVAGPYTELVHGKAGVVVEIDHFDSVPACLVRFGDDFQGHNNCEGKDFGKGPYYWLPASFLTRADEAVETKPMPTFKIGDKVKTLPVFGGDLPAGTVGVVSEITPDTVYVQLENNRVAVGDVGDFELVADGWVECKRGECPLDLKPGDMIRVKDD